MPYYDYKCKSCGTIFNDKYFTIENRLIPTTQTCSVCDELTVTLLIGAPAFNDPFSLGLAKPPAHVQDRIKQIKKANPNAGASLKGSKFGENLSY